MDVNLLQQILAGLQQNNANLTTLVNNQSQQFTQQLAVLQATGPVVSGGSTSAKGKIAKPEPFDGSPEKLNIFL